MVNKNITNLLGLAARANKIITGEMVLNAIRSSSCYLVIIAEDASDNTKKKYMDKCTYYNVPYTFIESSEELSHAIGKNNRMIIAISDKGFANKLETYMKG